MIHDLRLRVPRGMLRIVEVERVSAPFDFNFRPLHEVRLRSQIHDWLLDNQDHVTAEVGLDSYLVFADDIIATHFWLAFGEDFLDAHAEEEAAKAEFEALMSDTGDPKKALSPNRIILENMERLLAQTKAPGIGAVMASNRHTHQRAASRWQK